MAAKERRGTHSPVRIAFRGCLGTKTHSRSSGGSKAEDTVPDADLVRDVPGRSWMCFMSVLTPLEGEADCPIKVGAAVYIELISSCQKQC